MQANSQYSYSVYRSGGLKIEYNEKDERVIYSNDIRLVVRSTTDPVAKIVIEKTAEGRSYLDAKERAEAIEYHYVFEDGTLKLDGYFITDFANKYRDQEVDITLFLPEGTILFAEDNTYSFHRNSASYRDILNNGDEEKYLRILKGKTECIDCPPEEKQWNSTDETSDWEEEVLNEFDDDGPLENTSIPTPSEIEETTVQTDSTQTN